LSLLESYTDESALLQEDLLKKSFAQHLDKLIDLGRDVEAEIDVVNPLTKLFSKPMSMPISGMGPKSISEKFSSF